VHTRRPVRVTQALTGQAMLDTNTYEKSIKIADKDMKAFEARHLQRHNFHGDWNYTITAASGKDTTHPGYQE
jgi:hypothetical protein